MDELIKLLDEIKLPLGEYIRVVVFSDMSGHIEHIRYDGEEDIMTEFDNREQFTTSVKACYEYFRQEMPKSCLFKEKNDNA